MLQQTQKSVSDLNIAVLDIQARIAGGNDQINKVRQNIVKLERESDALIQKQAASLTQLNDVTNKIKLSQSSVECLKAGIENLSGEVTSKRQNVGAADGQMVVKGLSPSIRSSSPVLLFGVTDSEP